jgi:DeoR family glycerol-3-phosphate regulon repressor
MAGPMAGAAPGPAAPPGSRLQEILDLARGAGRVMVEDLAARFEVSPQTIRKDLNELCARRLLTRIHGGAIAGSGVSNLAYAARRLVAQAEKEAIGRAAAARIPNGASLFITIGTTTEEVAKALIQHEDLLVITNNLNVATLLYPHPRIEVIVAGGPVRRTDGAVTGEAAVSFIRQFKVDYAVIGASAIDPDGALLDFDYREVRVARAILENARQAILVADRTKFARQAPVRIGHLAEIDLFVTDLLPEAGIAEICRQSGVDVIETAPRASEPETRGNGRD